MAGLDALIIVKLFEALIAHLGKLLGYYTTESLFSHCNFIMLGVFPVGVLKPWGVENPSKFGTRNIQ